MQLGNLQTMKQRQKDGLLHTLPTAQKADYSSVTIPVITYTNWEFNKEEPG